MFKKAIGGTFIHLCEQIGWEGLLVLIIGAAALLLLPLILTNLMEFFIDVLPDYFAKKKAKRHPASNHNFVPETVEQPLFDGHHYVTEKMVYLQKELAPLKGQEIYYISKALREDHILKHFNIVYSNDANLANQFHLSRSDEQISITIRIALLGKKNDPATDEVYAQRMRFILNFLPFMTEK